MNALDGGVQLSLSARQSHVRLEPGPEVRRCGSQLETSAAAEDFLELTSPA